MRPFLLYAPRGAVPEALLERLAAIGAEVSIAFSAGEVAALLEQQILPDAILVAPPARPSDAASLLGFVERHPEPPPILVLTEGSAAAPVALEALGADSWTKAASDLPSGAGDPFANLLLPRAHLVTFLDLWERSSRGGTGLTEETLRSVAKALGAARLSLFRWREGDSHAVLEASSAGTAAVGRRVEIARYPELRAAAARDGPVLVEEVDRDPLMDDASLAGVPIRSLICQRLPSEPGDLYLHGVSERLPFGLSGLALIRAAVRYLAAPHGPPRAPKGLAAALEEMIQVLPEPTLVVGLKGKIAAANLPFLRLTGYLPAELVGRDYQSLLRPTEPEDQARPTDTRVGFLSRGLRRARFATASGEVIPVELLAPAQAPSSDVPYGLVSIRDRRDADARHARETIHQREIAEMEQRLEEKDKQLQRVVAEKVRFWKAAAHELRTPLAILRTHLEVVLGDLAGGVAEQPLGLLRSAAESLDRLERLIADILDAAAPAGPGARDTGEIDILSALRSVLSELSPAASRRGIELRLVAPAKVRGVRAGRDRLERLVANLIDHSLRLSPKKEPVVSVVVNDEGGQVSVRIVDSGPALSPERAAHLFDDLEASRGSGELPLAVAGRLASEMGARLSASTGPDGTNVKLLSWP